MYLVSHELLVADENHVVDVDMDHLMSHLLVQEILVDLVAQKDVFDFDHDLNELYPIVIYEYSFVVVLFQINLLHVDLVIASHEEHQFVNLVKDEP